MSDATLPDATLPDSPEVRAACHLLAMGACHLRLRILLKLEDGPLETPSIAHLAMASGIGRANITQHLHKLRDAGLVASEVAGIDWENRYRHAITPKGRRFLALVEDLSALASGGAGATPHH